jgi:large subunit ribosomal protein L21
MTDIRTNTKRRKKMFAVIKTGGKQYRVSAEEIVTVEKLAGEAGEMVEFADVLMVGEGDKATVGAPMVAGAMVTGEIVSQSRGPKVISFKKRRRQNSKRIRGHRQLLTTVRIAEILTDGAKPSRKAAAKPPKAEKAAKADNKPEAAQPVKEEAKAETAAPLFKAPKGKGDDLSKVKGIGKVASSQLNEQGITTYAQLAELTDKDIERIDAAMPFSAEQIADWRDQAKELAKEAKE